MLVQNTINKYRIQEVDIYNFNETRFMIGIILTVTVITSSEGYTKAKKIQPGNRE
jgi:hypothetical protein